MKSWMLVSTLMLTTALLAGCGAKLSAPTAALAAQTAQAQAAAVQVNTLIIQARAITGTDAPSITERIHVYTLLGHSNSDTAAAFLVSELDNQWVTWPDAMEDALEPALIAALDQLAADDVQLATEDAQTAAEGKGGAKKSHGRRFNIWTGIDKFFGVKKGHRGAGGGGKTPPASAPDPSAGGGDAAPAPSGGGAAPDPSAGAPAADPSGAAPAPAGGNAFG